MCQGQDSLKNHIRQKHLHATICDVSGENFPSEDEARVHYARMHGEVDCSECLMACVGTEGLKAHIKISHQEDCHSQLIHLVPPTKVVALLRRYLSFL